MKLNNRAITIGSGLVLVTALAVASLALAAAPVEDLNQSGGAMGAASEQATTYALDSNAGSGFNAQPQALNATSARNNGADNSRLARVDQQLNNLVNMNLPQQLAELQQQVQQLTGKVQEQEHTIKTLTEQQMSFYKDLDQRLTQSGSANSSKAAANIPAASTEPAAKSASPAIVPGAAGNKAQESSEYQTAVDYLMKKNYAKAGAGFNSYLAHYPNGAYAPSAYYWQGEVELNNHNLKQAADSFQAVIKKYPNSDKVNDAKLKLAMVHAQQGNSALARQELKRIKADHPGSTLAQLASIQLQQLDNPDSN